MGQILLVSHGTMAEGMYKAAGMVFGELPGVSYLCLSEDKGIETFKAELKQLLEAQDYEKPLTVLCDIGGGSPYNSTLELLSDRGHLEQSSVVAGMNLPLLLVLLMAPEATKETVCRCMEEARGNMMLFEMQEEDDEL